MKYLVFFGLSTQPKGGINDLIARKDTIDECYEALDKAKEEHKHLEVSTWGQVYDIEKNQKVYHFNDEFVGA